MEIYLNKQEFTENVPEIAVVYQQAFAGSPWFENLSIETVLGRINGNIGLRGFDAFLARNSDLIAGSLWFDTPTLDQIESERGARLRDFAEAKMAEMGTNNLIWEREIITKPEFQGQGIATGLRRVFLSTLNERYPSGSLIVSRMREDNIGIITIARKFGYQTSGVRQVSSQSPDLYHDFWFKEVTNVI